MALGVVIAIAITPVCFEQQLHRADSIRLLSPEPVALVVKPLPRGLGFCVRVGAQSEPIRLSFPLQRDLDRIRIDTPLADGRPTPHPATARAAVAMVIAHRDVALAACPFAARRLVRVALGLRRLAPVGDLAAKLGGLRASYRVGLD